MCLEWDKLLDEGVVKKIAEQISTIAFQAPHALHMDKEFALLQEAALQAFRLGIPEPGTFSEKISMLNILNINIDHYQGKEGIIF